MWLFPLILAGAVAAGADNATVAGPDVCAGPAPGPWAALLEDWATSPAVTSDRHGRIMALPPANGYYVTERIDGPLTPPHPPAHPPAYSEWQTSPRPGKIVNRPPSPYKDKFKPSYAPPTPGAPPPRPQRPADRVDSPPGKQVSETDLYLLGAIEKLVYRVDLMEKRLRRMEENVHLLVLGAETKPEPCPSNFTRVGDVCYWWSEQAVDWKDASAACRARRAALAEPHEPQRRALQAKLLADARLKGSDFWTGGLNPGLLWIWTQSARPLEGTVAGEGRCLALAHDAAAAAYVYRGRDCAKPLRYICQREDDKEAVGNRIEKAARSLRLGRQGRFMGGEVWRTEEEGREARK